MGGGHTVAGVGTGLDRVYPKKHLDLAHRQRLTLHITKPERRALMLP